MSEKKIPAGEPPIVAVKALRKEYAPEGLTGLGKVPSVKAVQDVSFFIAPGETLGLVGESGCGKSTIGKLLVGLEKPTAGDIFYQGQNIAQFDARRERTIRTEVQMVFQDPHSSLNPRRRIADILAAPVLYHGLVERRQIHAEVDRLLSLVGLPATSKFRFPHEFSGGQRQRIGIARALSLRPKLIVCDEPVSALDVSIQAQILNLFRDLQAELGVAYLFIGHGLSAVRYVSQRIAVMYLGRIVEIGPSDTLFRHPVHPYTRALCDAAPVSAPSLRARPRVILAGEVSSNRTLPEGCPFHPRCPIAQESCRRAVPALVPMEEGADHLVACPVAMAARAHQGKEGR